MNFEVNKLGRSFRGVMAYLMHDKRQADVDPHLATSARVAWAELRNLDGAADPYAATRIMIDTAQNADALKRAAGRSSAGRKSNGQSVFHMSLQWRGDELEREDRATMIDAAETALRILKLDHLQAVIIAHTDTAHPHVHVVVNRVNPETGIMTPIAAPDVKKLDKWADAFEVGRGLIVSPNRRRKYARDEIAAEPEAVPQVRDIAPPDVPLVQDQAQRRRGFLSLIFDRARVGAGLVRKWHSISGVNALQEHYPGVFRLPLCFAQSCAPALYKKSKYFTVANGPPPFERTFDG